MKKVILGDVCDFNPKEIEAELETLVSFVPMQNVSESGDIITSEHRKFEDVSKGFSRFCEGDVLFAKITPCMENGKGAIALNLKNGMGCGSTEFHVIRVKSTLLSNKWLYYYTKWDRFRKKCECNMTGSAGQKRVPKEYLAKCSISLPALEEQNRAINQLQLCESAIEKRKKQLKEFDNLIKSRFVEMFGEYFRTESNSKQLKDICDFIDYRGKTPEKSESGIPLITAKNVKSNSFNIEPQEFIPAVNYDEHMTRGIPRVNDVLFTTEAPLGNVCRIPNVYDKFCVGQRLITIQPHKEILNSEYVEMALLSKEFQDEMWRHSSGSTVKGIRSKELVLLTIPVPPLNLQNQYAAFVQQVDKLKVEAQKSLDEMQVLFDSLMQKYFG